MKILHAILNCINYARYLKGIPIMSNEIEVLKWRAFFEEILVEKCQEFWGELESLQQALSSKEVTKSTSFLS